MVTTKNASHREVSYEKPFAVRNPIRKKSPTIIIVGLLLNEKL